MIKDKEKTQLLPNGWEMWKTSTRWQAMLRCGTNEDDPNTYTGLYRTPGEAIREAKKKARSK